MGVPAAVPGASNVQPIEHELRDRTTVVPMLDLGATAWPAVRVVLTVLGTAAIEGSVISWVADQRKRHAFSDRPGDLDACGLAWDVVRVGRERRRSKAVPIAHRRGA